MNQNLIEKYISTNTQPLNDNHKKELLNWLSTNSASPVLRSKILIFLRKHIYALKRKELAKALKVDETQAESLLNNEIVEAFFPIAGDKTQKITKLFIIELKNKTFSFKESLKNELKLVEKLTGKHFFVGFYDDFYGSSFMLALISALIAKKKEKLNDYAFTGALNTEGKVIEADLLEEKMKALGKKRLIHSGIVKDLKELEVFLNSDMINIPFSLALKQSKKDATPKQAALTNLYQIKQNTEFELAKRLYDLKDDDFTFYTDDNFLPKDSWESLLKSAYNKILNLKEKVKDKTCILHFCFLAPATFCFGFGAMFGCKEPFVVYHYTSLGYRPVLDYSKRSTRILKSFTNSFDHMECKTKLENKNTETMALSVYTASHNPIGDIDRFLKENFNNYSIESCEAKDKGNLQEKDWTVYVNEIYSYYNKLKEITVNKKLLFFSCPVPLAFGLGVAIETFDNIDVYNYDPEKATYFKVLNLARLRV